MRIISGVYKGKKINQPKDKGTRPLKDLTKESIFNLISHSNKFDLDLKKSIVLDIFSGVGSFGIECLSRGAKFVFFFENYNGVLPLLKKNLISLNSKKNYKIIEKNVYDKNIFLEVDTKIDIIFLDPPYKDNNVINILKTIKDVNLLDEKGAIILHRHKNDKITLPEKYKIIEERKYGISKIFFLNYSN